jgi:ABC-type multidrug transport system permease subunit
MWGKSLRHQFLAPVRPWHIVLGGWLMGVLRGVVVFALLSAVSRWAFGVSFLGPGWLAAAAFLAGLLLSAGGVGLAVSSGLLVFGVHAEVTAWSGVSLVLLLCGIYTRSRCSRPSRPWQP